MNFEISTLKRWAFAAVICTALLLTMFIPALAQRGRGWRRVQMRPPYGRAYGYRRNHRRAQHQYRKELRRDLKRHQKYERTTLRNRLRYERGYYGNNQQWRERRRGERVALKLHQRAERESFKERFKGNKRGRG
ncbi:MAG: hypothetical protein WCB68_13135 [Pyrinomonadaceae bacterium]